MFINVFIPKDLKRINIRTQFSLSVGCAIGQFNKIYLRRYLTIWTKCQHQHNCLQLLYFVSDQIEGLLRIHSDGNRVIDGSHLNINKIINLLRSLENKTKTGKICRLKEGNICNFAQSIQFKKLDDLCCQTGRQGIVG